MLTVDPCSVTLGLSIRSQAENEPWVLLACSESAFSSWLFAESDSGVSAFAVMLIVVHAAVSLQSDVDLVVEIGVSESRAEVLALELFSVCSVSGHAQCVSSSAPSSAEGER
jgi:hypothetical protein